MPTIEFDLAKDTGQDILLLGSPFGLDFTIAKGIISYKDRVINSSANINFNNNAINSNNNTNIDNTSIEDHQIKRRQNKPDFYAVKQRRVIDHDTTKKCNS